MPVREHDHTGSKHLVDWSTTGLHTVAAAVQRLARAVESKSTILACNVYVEDEVGVVETYRRALAILLVEIVGNGILYAVGNEFGMTEHLAVHHCIHRECRCSIKMLFPVESLYSFIYLVGIRCLEVKERFQDSHCSPQVEIRLVHHLLVTGK